MSSSDPYISAIRTSSKRSLPMGSTWRGVFQISSDFFLFYFIVYLGIYESPKVCPFYFK